MKKFENPEMIIQVFDIEDVITTSGEQGGNGTIMPDQEV